MPREEVNMEKDELLLGKQRESKKRVFAEKREMPYFGTKENMKEIC